MSLSPLHKAAVGLALSVTGLAWVAYGSEQSFAARGGASAESIDDAAKRIALARWREYLTSIGWPQDMVRASAPDFLGAVSLRTLRTDGGWTVVFDGTRPGEIRKVTLELDAEGQELREPSIEWGDTFEIEDLYR